MSVTLQVNNQSIAAEEIIPLLTRHQLLPYLQREIIIDQAIADIKCTEDELVPARERIAGILSVTGSLLCELRNIFQPNLLRLCSITC